MKVKIGMKVFGECGQGIVVAMSEQWCIYKLEGESYELAEIWDDIRIPADGPEELVSSVTEVEVTRIDKD